jgi:hypothetical protein
MEHTKKIPLWPHLIADARQRTWAFVMYFSINIFSCGALLPYLIYLMLIVITVHNRILLENKCICPCRYGLFLSCGRKEKKWLGIYIILQTLWFIFLHIVSLNMTILELLKRSCAGVGASWWQSVYENKETHWLPSPSVLQTWKQPTSSGF